MGISMKPGVVGALLMAGAACSGCAAPAATVLPAAVSGAPVVIDSWETRERDSYWVAGYEDVVQAALRAGETLALELETENIEDARARLTYVDEQNAELTFYIERRTPTVTLVRYIASSDELSSFAGLYVREVIEQLRGDSPRPADALALHAFSGLTYAEIGELLGVSERTVGNDLKYAKAFVAARMQRND